MRTPWGPSQTIDRLAEGIEFISTAGHGGIKLSAERRKQMPPKFRDEPTFAGGNWYEEDCDVLLVVYCFPQYFHSNTVNSAHEYLKKTKPHLFT